MYCLVLVVVKWLCGCLCVLFLRSLVDDFVCCCVDDCDGYVVFCLLGMVM